MQVNRSNKVNVVVRTRPTSKFDYESIEFLPDNRTIKVQSRREVEDHNLGGRAVNNQANGWTFQVDGILHNSSQETVYEYIAQDIVSQTFDGYNGTLMCYGQTGSGKTFTMTGATETYQHRGIIPRALNQVYREIEARPDYSIAVRISYLEIYNEMMFDLLSTLPETPNNAPAMVVMEGDHGIEIKGLSSHRAASEEDALNLLFEGETNRAISEHTLNARSSRSHCIFTVLIETRSRTSSSSRYTTSKLNFVDLAGSERLSKTESAGKVKQEAMYINRSLTFLEQTILALSDRRRDHIPYRQSKLTHVLKDSIGGNCNMTMVANIWTENRQLEETTSTLRFAQRMMKVPVQPTINEQVDAERMVLQLRGEVASLRQELVLHDTLANKSGSYAPLSDAQLREIDRQVRRYVDGDADDIDVVNLRQIRAVFAAFRSVVVGLGTEIEERLRAKFELLEKQEEVVEPAVKGSEVAGESEGVGETDGRGFGVGVAPVANARTSSSILTSSKRSKRSRSREKGAEFGVAAAPSGATAAPSGVSVASAAPERPSTPPTRTAAFEDYRNDAGIELATILAENKHILLEKKDACRELAKRINSTKQSIDEVRVDVESKRNQRIEEGEYLTENGDPIIGEEEYFLIKHLKELKSRYRVDYEDLRNVRAEVHYCQKLVDQCRQRLITEFDGWYSRCFLSASGEFEGSTAAGVGLGEQPGRRLDCPEDRLDEMELLQRRQQELRLLQEDSAVYHQAKMRTIERKELGRRDYGRDKSPDMTYKRPVNQLTMAH